MTQMVKYMNSPARRPLATRSPRAARKAAFTLIEVTLALGVTAFCLLAIFGLLPIGLRSNRAAIAQTTANGILSAVAADLRATAASTSASTGTASAQFQIPIPSNPLQPNTPAFSLYFAVDGSFSPSLSGSATHLLTVTYPPTPTTIPAAAGPAPTPSPKVATYLNLEVSWPAASGTANAEGFVTTFVALDRN